MNKNISSNKATNLEPSDVWYTETWCHEDVIRAMEEEGVTASAENILSVEKNISKIFDDKSTRNDIINSVIRSLFCF